MEAEKTIDELKTENQRLTQDLLQVNEKIKNLGSVLIDAKECNVKLVYSVKLFAEAHLTRDEKLSIAQELDRAVSAEQVEKIYNKYIQQLKPDGVDVESDFLWSPGFTRDLEKYYFSYKGYNPFEVIDTAVQTIRNQFRIENELIIEENPQKIENLKASWQENKEAAVIAVGEILDITNEILKK